MQYNIDMPREQQEEYQKFAREKLGFEFDDISLLITALTHRSYVNEHPTSHDHNERLEFLGDAVLELVTSEYLFRTYHQSEGIMTAWRSALVNTESIGESGIKLGYPPLVRLSRGEGAGSDRAHYVIYADCFEAVIGAIYIDKGYDAAADFINKHIISKLPEILETDSWRDPKSLFQEISQRQLGEIPTYQLVSMTGPDHNREFTINATIGGKVYGTGIGHSKQEAQVAAARQGVQKMKDLGLYRPRKFHKHPSTKVMPE